MRGGAAWRRFSYLLPPDEPQAQAITDEGLGLVSSARSSVDCLLSFSLDRPVFMAESLPRLRGEGRLEEDCYGVWMARKFGTELLQVSSSRGLPAAGWVARPCSAGEEVTRWLSWVELGPEAKISLLSFSFERNLPSFAFRFVLFY